MKHVSRFLVFLGILSFMTLTACGPSMVTKPADSPMVVDRVETSVTEADAVSLAKSGKAEPKVVIVPPGHTVHLKGGVETESGPVDLDLTMVSPEPPKPETHWYQEWWVWTLTGAVLVGGGVAIGCGVSGDCGGGGGDVHHRLAP